MLDSEEPYRLLKKVFGSLIRFFGGLLVIAIIPVVLALILGLFCFFPVALLIESWE